MLNGNEGEVEKVENEKRSASVQSNQKVLLEKTQRNSKERSRSRKKKRSRSKETKKKEKHKHKHRSHRGRSYSSSELRSRSRDRKRSKDRKKYINRGRSREKKRNYNHHREYRPEFKYQAKNQSKIPTQIPMPNIPAEIPMPEIPGERRRRQRSRSPLDYYRKNQNNNDGEFWDSFSWQPRINYTPNVSTSALANTKKMRRLMITSIPYEIGITEDNLRDLITRFMSQNYLKDQMNNCPVVNLQINEPDHNVAVELSSVEETCRMCRMEKIQLFKGHHSGIVRLGDSIYGNSVLAQAQTAGQAQAAAFAAINVIQNKKTNFTIDAYSGGSDKSSTVLRIVNAVTSYMASHLTTEEWEDYHEDLLEGFKQYGTIVHDWFVKEGEKDICSDSGNLFIEYEYRENAEAAMSEMQGRPYDERNIELFYIPRDLYYKNFKSSITPPTLPPPLKTTTKNK